MIVVLDIGTSNMRAAILDGAAKVLNLECVKYDLKIGGSGQVEMDMNVFDHALSTVLSATASFCQSNGIHARAIVLTSQRSSVIPVDSKGHALYKALMWQDTRSTFICEEFSPYREEIYQIAGVRLSPVFSAPKIVYLKRSMPELYEKSYKLIGFAEYTINKLCGVFATDTSYASRSAMFDIHYLTWSNRLLDLFSVDYEKLCPIVPVGSVISDTTGWVKGLFGYPIPVVSAGGDQQCAALGNGCFQNSDIMANLGTGAYVLALADHVTSDPKMRLSINVSAIPGMWVYEGAVLSAGKTLDWVNRTFFAEPGEQHPYQRFTIASRNSPAGANGLCFDINFAGKGTPQWDPSRRGSITNLNFSNTKDDIARAVMEGIAFEIGECVEVVESVIESKSANIHVSGGLCRDELQNEILSAVLQKQVVYTKEVEATILGAWMSASVTIGYFETVASAYQAAKQHGGFKNYRASDDLVAIYQNIKERNREYTR
jgi:sugar (pentulose or hexulose) kinase